LQIETPLLAVVIGCLVVVMLLGGSRRSSNGRRGGGSSAISCLVIVAVAIGLLLALVTVVPELAVTFDGLEQLSREMLAR
jgi:uncharacterized membrane protein YhaH (DUF805 family)